jgi:hypothetical protein
MIKRLLAGAVGVAASIALAAVPAQALTTVTGGPDTPTAEACDNANWDWKISNPARYQAGDHEAVVGLSDATRTVTILAPTDAGACRPEAGDRWRIYNGYFSAEGTFSAAEVGVTGRIADSDVVTVEKPNSNSVAGDDIGVHLKVSDPDFTGWEVDNYSEVAPLNILRRTVFNYHGTDNRINFSEPYVVDEPIRSGGNLLRASWSSNAYYGYENRNVHAQWRPDVTPSTGYSDSDAGIVDSVLTGAGGSVKFSFTVEEAGGPNPGDTFIARALYRGNGTSSGNWSTGDRIAPAGG